MDCYIVIEESLIVDYNKINYHVSIFEKRRGCSWGTQKMWAWLCLEPPLLKLLEVITGWCTAMKLICLKHFIPHTCSSMDLCTCKAQALSDSGCGVFTPPAKSVVNKSTKVSIFDDKFFSFCCREVRVN